MTEKLRTWAEIDLNCIKENYEKIQNHTNKNIMCIVKADAYGHGLCKVAKALPNAKYFGVATALEAINLRLSGVTSKILLLGYFNDQEAKNLIENDITVTIYSRDMANTLNLCAISINKTCDVHIKIDTGMSRLGFLPNDINNIAYVSNLSNINTKGIYTHFAVADDPLQKDFTFNQSNSLDILCEKLKEKDVTFEVKHAQASSGALLYNNMDYDVVRVGIALYGYTPSEDIKNTLNLKPAMKVYSKIAHVHQLKKGETVSYGRRFKAERDMKIAVVSIGYADGYKRSYTNKPYMLVRGKKASVLGSICMDMCMIDVTNIDIKIGENVLVFGETDLLATDVAKFSNTIVYEVLCAVSSRVPRIYT